MQLRSTGKKCGGVRYPTIARERKPVELDPAWKRRTGPIGVRTRIEYCGYRFSLVEGAVVQGKCARSRKRKKYDRQIAMFICHRIDRTKRL